MKVPETRLSALCSMRIAAITVLLLWPFAGVESRTAGPANDDATPGPQPVVVNDSEYRSAREARLLLPWQGDLEGMRDRGLVRVATTFSRTNFFLDGGRPRGATYELLMAFRRHLRQIDESYRDIDVLLLPMPRDSIVEAVRSGRADIAAANLSITPRRSAILDFSTPIATGIRELVVTGPAAPAIRSLEDLSGIDVHVRASSSYYESLQKLAADFSARQVEPPIIHPVDENLETEDILELVSRGVFEVTVADSSLTGLWADMLPELTVHEELSLSENSRIAWAFRKNSPQLTQVANAFIGANRKGSLLGNILTRRYFKANPWVRNPLNEDDTARLEELADTFKAYADRYGIDWLLSAAQAYQESGLDQSQVSAAGAVGVMQLLPTTAADPNVGITDIDVVENNIHAGIKYKHFLRNRYFDDPELGSVDRWLFTLAAYNAGPARINRYRRRAETMGLDPDRWFRHVEQVSNGETRQYVSNIFKYYISYQEYQRRIALLKNMESARRGSDVQR